MLCQDYRRLKDQSEKVMFGVVSIGLGLGLNLEKDDGKLQGFEKE